MDEETKGMWKDVWLKNELPFHNESVYPALMNEFSPLGLERGSSILVPLCGKSFDMIWFKERGYRVTGIELSEHAVRCFFSEHGMTYELVEQGAHKIFRARGIEIFCGDIFALDPEQLSGAPFAAIYDRAAFVALDSKDRPDYLGFLEKVLMDRGKIFMTTLNYDEQPGDGPPYSIDQAELENNLLKRSFELEKKISQAIPGGIRIKSQNKPVERTYWVVRLRR